MDEFEIQKLISHTNGCLNCGKALSIEILKSRFCVECNIKYVEQIRNLKKKSTQVRLLEGGDF